jgi:hypothetical protein
MRRWRLLLEALVAVALVRAALTLRRTEAVRRRIARHGATRTPSLEDQREVAWSVAATARLVPGASCLTQALAGQALLARRGTDSTVRISIPAAAADGVLRPHAWLLAGSTILLGGSSQLYAAHRTVTEFRAGPSDPRGMGAKAQA